MAEGDELKQSTARCWGGTERHSQRWPRMVCPSDGLTDELVAATVDEVASIVLVLSPWAQRAVRGLATALEHGTRAWGGRSFSSLNRKDARIALDRWNRGPARMGISLLRDLVLVAYYEQPSVRRGVGYEPDQFIAVKKVKRLEQWSEDIVAHEQLLMTRAPLRPARVGAPREPGGLRFGPGSDRHPHRV